MILASGAGAAEDRLVPAASNAAAAKAEGGKWELSVAAAPDGGKAIVASLPANAPIVSGFAKVTPSLRLRYGAGRTAAYVLFDTFLGSGTVDVTIRIGTETTHERWRISNDGRAVFAPGEALGFMTRLKQADTFSITVSRPKGDPVTADFATAGIEVVLKALISAGVKYG